VTCKHGYPEGEYCPACGDIPYLDEDRLPEPLSPADHEAREPERRYESWLESLKDHGP
jgi:hypothetical protein